jgi:hypothetical protein
MRSAAGPAAPAWVMPGLVVLWRDGRRVAAACGYLLFGLAPLWWTPHAGQTGDYGSHGVITLIANCFLLAGVAFVTYKWRGCWPSAGSLSAGSRLASSAREDLVCGRE